MEFVKLTRKEAETILGEKKSRFSHYHVRHSYRPVPMIQHDIESDTYSVAHPDDPMKIVMTCECGETISLGQLVHEIWVKPHLVFRISKRNLEGTIAALLEDIRTEARRGGQR